MDAGVGAADVEESNGKLNGSREMVTPVIRANLEKQVYIYV